MIILFSKYSNTPREVKLDWNGNSSWQLSSLFSVKHVCLHMHIDPNKTCRLVISRSSSFSCRMQTYFVTHKIVANCRYYLGANAQNYKRPACCICCPSSIQTAINLVPKCYINSGTLRFNLGLYPTFDIQISARFLDYRIMHASSQNDHNKHWMAVWLHGCT